MTLDDKGPMNGNEIDGVAPGQTAASDSSEIVTYEHYVVPEVTRTEGSHKLKMPTLEQLLAARFEKRQYLLAPWLREEENCMVYAATGVGKSLFAVSAALAVAGGGEFLGWRPEAKPDRAGWRVLYVDGEMHIADIQARVRQLRAGMPKLEKASVDKNLSFLARQHQDGGVQFPSITEQAGQAFILDQLNANKIDLVILDNFSTLGEVEDENAAASFNAIQQFLLQLKVQKVATMLVHHTGKAGDNFRGSSKLAATFETIIQLEHPQLTYRNHKGITETRTYPVVHGEARFRVRWDKVRAGSSTPPKAVVARLENLPPKEFGGERVATWEYEPVGVDRLDEIVQGLADGMFTTQVEIAKYYNVSPKMAGKYLEKAIRLGMLTKETISRGFGLGKRKRELGKTEPPVSPDIGWETETLSETIPSEVPKL
jgi:hypothetical protein